MVVKTLSLVCGCYEWGREVGEPDKGSKRANRRPIDVSVFLRQSRTRIPILLQFTVEKSQTTSICLLMEITPEFLFCWNVQFTLHWYIYLALLRHFWRMWYFWFHEWMFNIRATLKLFHIEQGWRDKYYLLITKIISDNNESKSGDHPP